MLSRAGFEGLDKLKPFHFLRQQIFDIDLMISRTGFTGDLGYEIWISPEHAINLWDLIYAECENGHFDIRPIGLNALNMAVSYTHLTLPTK